MPHRHFVTVLLLLFGAVLGQDPALKGLDPVELVRGNEQAGTSEFTLQHGRFRYLFATADNLATFRADPEPHAIQWGGACARMGPLSGGGDPARWLVHEGRIYVFASDQCRDGFRKQPARFFDADLPQPPADAAGEALLARAIAAHGGAERLRAWRTYQHEHQRTDGDTTQVWRVQIAFPDRCRTEHDYLQGKEQWHFANVLTPDAAFAVTRGKAEPLHASARRETTRLLRCDPVVALRRAVDGPHVATDTGKATIGDTTVERCELWLDGAVVTLGLGADGRILTLSSRARGPQLWFGALDLRFDDYELHDGVLLPHRVRATFDGKPAADLDQLRQGVAVDAPLGDELFRAPL